MGSDRIETITFKIPQNALHTLALMAHEKNVTLNDLIDRLCTDEAKRIIEEHRRTSEDDRVG